MSRCRTLYGRKVLATALDPVPPLLRCGPGVVVLNEREQEQIVAEVTKWGYSATASAIGREIHHHERSILAHLINEALQ